jgi:3-deoxy-D-manno-octulosonic-acid transferase
MLVIMETELWPNALSLTAARGIPVFTMNSKISRRSFPRYQKLLWLLGPALRCVRGWCVQTEDDARRVATLTGHAWPSLEGPIQVTGNVKFDLTLDAPDTAAIGQLREKLGLAQGDRLVVVGSTHPGEEESILGALGPVIAARRNTVLALVPRHPERFGEAWSIISRMGAEARRLSDEATTAGGPSAPRVVLVDAMGLLVRLYAACDVAIVAGSFSGLVGGHNVLEPAVFAKPVIFGMDMRGQPEMAQVLRDGDGCVQCPIQTLGAEVARLLDNPLEAAALGERAKRAVDTNRGAARRSVEQVLHWINAMPLPAPTIS